MDNERNDVDHSCSQTARRKEKRPRNLANADLSKTEKFISRTFLYWPFWFVPLLIVDFISHELSLNLFGLASIGWAFLAILAIWIFNRPQEAEAVEENEDEWREDDWENEKNGEKRKKLKETKTAKFLTCLFAFWFLWLIPLVISLFIKREWTYRIFLILCSGLVILFPITTYVLNRLPYEGEDSKQEDNIGKKPTATIGEVKKTECRGDDSDCGTESYEPQGKNAEEE